jgi:hypothetical protein
VKIVKRAATDKCNSMVVFPEYPYANFILYKFDLVKEIMTAKFIMEGIKCASLTTTLANIGIDRHNLGVNSFIPLTITKNFIHFILGKTIFLLPIGICVDDALPYELVCNDTAMSKKVLVFVNNYEYIVMIGLKSNPKIAVFKSLAPSQKQSLKRELESTMKYKSLKKSIMKSVRFSSHKEFVTKIVLRKIRCTFLI